MQNITTVHKDTVVTLNYRVTDPAGEVLDEGNSDLQYVHGGYGDIFPNIESALDGKTVGESVTVTLAPQDAFGEHEAAHVIVESMSAMPAGTSVGSMLEGPSAEDPEVVVGYRVTAVDGDQVTLDGNHPLAGKTLVFACTVAAVRAATPDEVEAQTVGGGCCGDSDCGECPCSRESQTVH